jgi:hypothetical protein
VSNGASVVTERIKRTASLSSAVKTDAKLEGTADMIDTAKQRSNIGVTIDFMLMFILNLLPAMKKSELVAPRKK